MTITDAAAEVATLPVRAQSLLTTASPVVRAALRELSDEEWSALLAGIDDPDPLGMYEFLTPEAIELWRVMPYRLWVELENEAILEQVTDRIVPVVGRHRLEQFAAAWTAYRAAQEREAHPGTVEELDELLEELGELDGHLELGETPRRAPPPPQFRALTTSILTAAPPSAPAAHIHHAGAFT